MPDRRFFKNQGPFSLEQLASKLSVEIHGSADAAFQIDDVAPLNIAEASDLSFLDNIKYRDQFRATKAGACIVSPEFIADAPEGMVLLLSHTPYKTYALAAQTFYPDCLQEGIVSPNAYIDPSAEVGEGCVVDSGAVIEADVRIGKGTHVESGAVIKAGTLIGDHCKIGACSTVSHAVIGDYVRLYPGVRVGQDGFGFAPDPAGHVKVPQLGRVIIEDHVEIGANTTIDRGSGPDTVIGQGTWIDNLVQIGHNVKIGQGCVIVAQVGISGSTVIEDFVMFGGQVGVAGHLHIGSGARIGAQSGVMRDVPPGEEQLGSPAVSTKQFMRQTVALNRLIKRKKDA